MMIDCVVICYIQDDILLTVGSCRQEQFCSWLMLMCIDLCLISYSHPTEYEYCAILIVNTVTEINDDPVLLAYQDDIL